MPTMIAALSMMPDTTQLSASISLYGLQWDLEGGQAMHDGRDDEEDLRSNAPGDLRK